MTEYAWLVLPGLDSILYYRRLTPSIFVEIPQNVPVLTHLYSHMGKEKHSGIKCPNQATINIHEGRDQGSDLVDR